MDKRGLEGFPKWSVFLEQGAQTSSAPTLLPHPNESIDGGVEAGEWNIPHSTDDVAEYLFANLNCRELKRQKESHK